MRLLVTPSGERDIPNPVEERKLRKPGGRTRHLSRKELGLSMAAIDQTSPAVADAAVENLSFPGRLPFATQLSVFTLSHPCTYFYCLSNDRLLVSLRK